MSNIDIKSVVDDPVEEGDTVYYAKYSGDITFGFVIAQDDTQLVLQRDKKHTIKDKQNCYKSKIACIINTQIEFIKNIKAYVIKLEQAHAKLLEAEKQKIEEDVPL